MNTVASTAFGPLVAEKSGQSKSLLPRFTPCGCTVPTEENFNRRLEHPRAFSAFPGTAPVMTRIYAVTRETRAIEGCAAWSLATFVDIARAVVSPRCALEGSSNRSILIRTEKCGRWLGIGDGLLSGTADQPKQNSCQYDA